MNANYFDCLLLYNKDILFFIMYYIIYPRWTTSERYVYMYTYKFIAIYNADCTFFPKVPDFISRQTPKAESRLVKNPANSCLLKMLSHANELQRPLIELDLSSKRWNISSYYWTQIGKIELLCISILKLLFNLKIRTAIH